MSQKETNFYVLRSSANGIHIKNLIYKEIYSNYCPINCGTCYCGNGTCVECISGFVVDTSNNICEPCISNCDTCQITALDKCMKCKKDYYLHSAKNKCELDCPLGEVKNDVIFECEKCQVSNCQKCLLTEKDFYCQECEDYHYLSLNKDLCDKNCPHGEVGNSTNFNCEKCLVSNCQTCKLEQKDTECKLCLAGYVLSIDNKNCLDSCEIGQFENILVHQCQNCTSHCKQCTNLDKCDSCIEGYYLSAEQDKCLNRCQDGEYYNLQYKVCKKCLVSNCQQCNYQTLDHCESCFQPYLLSANQSSCDTSCSEGEVQIGTNSWCSNCYTNNCKICSNTNLNSCLQCTDGYELIIVNSLTKCIKNCGLQFYDFGSDSCISFCPYEYFMNKEQHFCQLCQEKYNNGCTSCDNSQCFECKDSYLDTINGICITNCPDGYIEKDSDNSCQSCSSFLNIQYCVKCSIDSCLQCDFGFYLDLNQNKCLNDPKDCSNNQVGLKLEEKNYICTNLENCSSFLILDTLVNECKSCHSSCKTCLKPEDPEQCLECYNNSFRFINQLNQNYGECKKIIFYEVSLEIPQPFINKFKLVFNETTQVPLYQELSQNKNIEISLINSNNEKTKMISFNISQSSDIINI